MFTNEEVTYCQAVIKEFQRGYLDADAGDSIRKYLAKKLSCSFLRITKRFPDTLQLPPFVPKVIDDLDDGTKQEIENARVRLHFLSHQ